MDDFVHTLIMEFEFLRFCGCSDAAYGRLKACIHTCGEAGRSYEFSPCRMPVGCVPEHCVLGFYEKEGQFLLYFRPVPQYRGKDSRLRTFFSRTHCYADFGAMVMDLCALTAPTLFDRLCRELKECVVGQEEAIEATAFKLCGYLGKKQPNRPLSLIFYGSTGVGKSELGKQLAQVLNRCTGQGGYRTVWTELNTFTQAHSSYRLIGAPPGYVGYDDPSVLEEVRNHPEIVFCFDELEKAHPEILKIFMSILDEGRCTAHRADEQGNRELDFRRCVFVFTTNAPLAHSTVSLGFHASVHRPPLAFPTETGGLSLAQRIFRQDEQARQAMVRSGVLREIAGRFSGLIGFQELDFTARTEVTRRQIIALGREYGLTIQSVSRGICAALTPAEEFSVRSTVGVLEGLFMPLFLSCQRTDAANLPLRLAGTLDCPHLLPINSSV